MKDGPTCFLDLLGSFVTHLLKGCICCYKPVLTQKNTRGLRGVKIQEVLLAYSIICIILKGVQRRTGPTCFLDLLGSFVTHLLKGCICCYKRVLTQKKHRRNEKPGGATGLYHYASF